jgi:hypothetical protein
MTRNFQNLYPFMGQASAEGRSLVFLMAIRRNSVAPVSYQNDLLQRMGIMLMTRDEAARARGWPAATDADTPASHFADRRQSAVPSTPGTRRNPSRQCR